MLRLEWATPAADELEAAQTYYHDLNPTAARTLARRIFEAARLLREGTREWVVSRTPYVLVYRETAQAVDPACVERGTGLDAV